MLPQMVLIIEIIILITMTMFLFFLSYDVAVIQWMRSFHKKMCDHTTLALTRNVIDNVRINNVFSQLSHIASEGDKIPLSKRVR